MAHQCPDCGVYCECEEVWSGGCTHCPEEYLEDDDDLDDDDEEEE